MTSSNGNIFRVTCSYCGEPVNSPHKGERRGALICAWMNGRVNIREVGDLRRHRTHYDVTVMNVGNPILEIIRRKDLYWWDDIFPWNRSCCNLRNPFDTHYNIKIYEFFNHSFNFYSHWTKLKKRYHVSNYCRCGISWYGGIMSNFICIVYGEPSTNCDLSLLLLTQIVIADPDYQLHRMNMNEWICMMI